MLYTVLWLVVFALILLFGMVVFFGAPFLPTLNNRVEDALNLLELKPGQTMLELGSGDGRLMLAAAKKGIRSVGYEINPLLFTYSKVLTWRYRKLVKIYCKNYWNVDWPKADGIYVFLLQPYMEKLNNRLKEYKHKPIKLVSFAFKIESKKCTKENNGLRLYTYN